MNKQEYVISLILGYILYVIGGYLLYPSIGFGGIVGIFLIIIGQTFLTDIAKKEESRC